MGYLITYSGEHFDPLTDSFSKINITDIAHSLSHICRANGHCRIFYSVAQHCIACAAEARARDWMRGFSWHVFFTMQARHIFPMS